MVWIGLLAVLGPLAGKLTSVQENDNAAFLPASAESTRVLDLQRTFSTDEAVLALVVYERPGGLTAGDQAAIAADLEAFGALDNLGGPVPPPLPSPDGEAVQVFVPLDAARSDDIGPAVERLRELASDENGLTGHVTGPAGLLADFVEVFESIDTTLLFTTAAVVFVILVIVYRSPIFLPVLIAAGLSLTLAQAVVYLLAREDVLAVNGQSAGILLVLVFGAGTDYALLLISRFREELGRHPSKYAAMRAALRGAVEPIVASGLTCVAGLLMLLFSQLNSNRGLGPVSAVGILAAMTAMLTFLPALLLLLGRYWFWPFVPRFREARAPERGLWAGVARLVGRRPRAAWVGTTVVLLALAAGTVQLDANGITQSESFTRDTDSVAGQEVLGRHYPAGSGSPAVIIAAAPALAGVLAVTRETEGVAAAIPVTAPGSPGAAPLVVDGRVQIEATLVDPADSAAAGSTIEALRERVDAADPTALVGGFTAVEFDTQIASGRDRNLIIPLVLLVIFVILALLLRALLAPLLLIATVVLSFFATLGVCALVFTYLLGFPAQDASFPLFAFVFLVALGIDYNIFLMTRVREESMILGTRAGVLRGLAVTGGVITSAGVVLAATFSVLGVLPLVFLAQLGFAVAFGVLLDTLIVRSILVPALSYDIGRVIWWPHRLGRWVGPEIEPDRMPASAPGRRGRRGRHRAPTRASSGRVGPAQTPATPETAGGTAGS